MKKIFFFLFTAVLFTVVNAHAEIRPYTFVRDCYQTSDAGTLYRFDIYIEGEYDTDMGKFTPISVRTIKVFYCPRASSGSPQWYEIVGGVKSWEATIIPGGHWSSVSYSFTYDLGRGDGVQFFQGSVPIDGVIDPVL